MGSIPTVAEFLEEQRGATRFLTLHRPAQRNALTPELVAALRQALVRADADPAARVVCVTGSGEHAFCAGADLGRLESSQGFLPAHEAGGGYAALLVDLTRLGKPVVACVNGSAFGGGLGLVAACDLAVAADDARFGTPEVDLGLFPYMALAPLQRVVGRRAALELALTGRRIDAAEAVRIGLLNAAVPRGQLAARVDALCETLAGKSAAVLRLGRRAFYATQDLPYEPAVFAAIRREIEARCPVILNFSTGGIGSMEGRVAHIREVKPALGALNMGSMNYAKYSARRKEFVFDFVFENTFKDIAYLLRVMKEAGVKPELECFDVGHTNSIWPLLDQGLLKRPLQFSFIMGVLGGIRATAENLAVQAREAPPDSTWEVVGISHEQWRMVGAALALGGNVRVGLEDNFYLDAQGTQMARSNGGLGDKAVRMARDVVPEHATVAEARALLSLEAPW